MRIFTTILAVFLFFNMVSAQKYLMTKSTYTQAEDFDEYIEEYTYEYERNLLMSKTLTYEDFTNVDSFYYYPNNLLASIESYDEEIGDTAYRLHAFYYDKLILDNEVIFAYNETNMVYDVVRTRSHTYSNDTLRSSQYLDDNGILLEKSEYFYDSEGRLIKEILTEIYYRTPEVIEKKLHYNTEGYFYKYEQVNKEDDEFDLEYEVFYDGENAEYMFIDESGNRTRFDFIYDTTYLDQEDNRFFEAQILGFYLENIQHKNRLIEMDGTSLEGEFLIEFEYTENTVKTSEHKALLPLTVYPNPTSDHFIVDVQDPQAVMNMYDVHGKLVHKQDVGLYRRVDVSALTPGTYICTIQSKGQLMSGKVVVR